MPPAALRIGLDIGATKTLGVVLEGASTVRAQALEPTVPGARGVVDTAARVVARLCELEPSAAGLPVGVGVPGLVEPERGTVRHAVNLEVAGEVLPLAALLGERLDAPVLVENDVNAATLGAAAHLDADDLAYLSIGTGLAAGLVLDGRVRRGVAGAAGEVGHVPVDPAGRACRCGQRGCLETVASGGALAEAWPSTDRPPASALFAAADAGIARAVSVRAAFVTGVAAAVRVLALTVDPRVVVLGGGVSSLGEPLRAAVARELADRARSSEFLASLDLAARVRVLPSGFPVAAVGAALLTRGGGGAR
ncbi:ROK family protein [Nocardioides ferulae]|uniref:ROK family protein n=1 Tax=Nocardioides ferulae TaxID=2340821 RepID=UPI001980D77B|nr:ROK family protein [Nocardioides ferulae]